MGELTEMTIGESGDHQRILINCAMLKKSVVIWFVIGRVTAQKHKSPQADFLLVYSFLTLVAPREEKESKLPCSFDILWTIRDHSLEPLNIWFHLQHVFL